MLFNVINQAIEQLRFTVPAKNSGIIEQHKKLIEDIDNPFFPTALAAVVEKWMTLCQNHFIDEIMQWRLKMMAFAINKNEVSLLKLLIGFKRSEAEK